MIVFETFVHENEYLFMNMFGDVSVAFSTDRKHYSLKKKRTQGSKTSASFHFFIKKMLFLFFMAS